MILLVDCVTMLLDVWLVVCFGGFTTSCLSVYFILVACVGWRLCASDSGWFTLVVKHCLVVGLVDNVFSGFGFVGFWANFLVVCVVRVSGLALVWWVCAALVVCSGVCVVSGCISGWCIGLVFHAYFG